MYLALGLAVVMVAVFVGLTQLTGSAPKAGEGTASALGVQLYEERPQAPDFALRRINGKEIRLSSLKGKVVFVNFFATWCTPCKWEMPEMEAIYQDFRDKGFEIVAISVDSTPDPIAPFAESLRLTFPIVHDPGMRVARQYGFRGPPLSFLVDRQGRIVGGASGPRKWSGSLAKNLVKKLLAEPAA